MRFTVTDAVQLIAGGTVIGAVAEVDDLQGSVDSWKKNRATLYR